MPRRTEIWFHYQDGRILITGSPGPRGWYANMTANLRFAWHFKQSLTRDIPAVATPITDEGERRALFARMMELEERMAHVELDDWAKRSPMVEGGAGLLTVVQSRTQAGFPLRPGPIGPEQSRPGRMSPTASVRLASRRAMPAVEIGMSSIPKYLSHFVSFCIVCIWPTRHLSVK